MNQTIKTLTENKSKIVELLENFSREKMNDLTKSQILDFLHKVSFHTENFFFDEELFLEKHKMPSYDKHVAEHKSFVDKMVYFQKKLENNDLSISPELFEYVNDWYRFHILKNDNEIIEFIEKFI